MTQLLPWQLHPSLALPRLQGTAGILWRVRTDVALRMEPRKGDTLWGVGCNAFERSCFALAQASKGEFREWLSVTRKDNHFVVRIGGVPIRFYRSIDDELAPSRYADPAGTEADDLSNAYSLFENPAPDRVFRFEMETAAKGMPARISIVQVDAERRKFNAFVIPVRLATRKPAKRKAAVTLRPPQVGTQRESAKLLEFGSKPEKGA